MKPEKKLEIESRIAGLLKERGTSIPCDEAYHLLYPDQVPPHYFRGVWEHVLTALPGQPAKSEAEAVAVKTAPVSPAPAD